MVPDRPPDTMDVSTSSRSDDTERLRALVSRARLGDEDAWEAIFRMLYPRLFHFARRRLPSDQAADDAVSESIMRAIVRIETYVRQPAGLGGWIFGILRNVIREQWRAGGHELPAEHLDIDSSDDLGPLALLVDREQAVAIRRAFARLDDDERELLELRVIAGLPSADIAEMLGATPGSVRTAQSRALKRLGVFYSEISDGRV